MKAEQISASHRDGVVRRMQGCRTVLAIQDTTDLSFASHRQTTGLGFINQSTNKGIKVHSCLAVREDGQPLGLLHQQCWHRAQRRGQSAKRKQKPIEAKESYRWLQTVTAAEADLSDELQVVHVGDREADIFELFAHPRREKSELLIRAVRNRRVEEGLGLLMPTLEQAPVAGEVELMLERNPRRPARQVRLRLRAISVTIKAPSDHPQRRTMAPVTLNSILVEEVEPPAEVKEPVRWVLLTSLSVNSFEEIWRCVVWYSYRWRIERFHYTLKSGCGMEALQLRTGERLQKALATYNIVACRLMTLTYGARLSPDAPCSIVFSASEWRVLRRKFEPKNRSPKTPTLRQSLIWVARLGGFLGRKGDQYPGLKTLWRGMSVFHNLLEGTQLSAIRQ